MFAHSHEGCNARLIYSQFMYTGCGLKEVSPLSKVIKGKYKNGVFEPLEPVDLRENETVEIVVPEKGTDGGAAFLSSFGTWKDIVPESFIEEVYERRVRGSRPPIDL
jgi:predicted DNA-binding antitoxin AbrB/MazE fold protein